jgi:hypothetical protein
MDDYVQILARMHHLDLDPFVQAGIELSPRPADAALTGIRAYERAFRLSKVHPDPFMEFCLRWLKRHPPRHHVRPSVVVWDSGQFLHRQGRITAVIDIELAHIGDPMMDLAGLRMRSSVIDYGNLNDLYRRYEELTGDEVDLDAIEYHHFSFTITTQLALHRAVADPAPETDLMNYMQWCSECNLYAVEALADLVGVTLDKVELPAPQYSPASAAHRHLVDSIRAMEGVDEVSSYQLRAAYRLARHLKRFDEIGSFLAECDIDEVAAIVGRRPSDWADAERMLEAFVLEAETGYDADLIRLFHRRLERQRFLLGPDGSAIARHLPIQPIRSPST